MTRLHMSGNLPAELAERISDNARELTASEQAQIDSRAQELIAERLTDVWRFCELMCVIDEHSYEPYLHRALMRIDNARAGDPIAASHVLAAIGAFAAVVRSEAEIVWRNECEDIAERELP